MTTLRDIVYQYALRAADDRRCATNNPFTDPANAAARSFVALLTGALQPLDAELSAAVWAVISDSDPLA